MAVETDITADDDTPIFSGEDRTITFTVYDSNGPDGGVAEDITGWALSWAAGPVSKTTGGGGIALTDPTNGIATVTLDAADLTQIEGKRYQYRFRRTDAGSNVVLAHGEIFAKSTTQA
jgi:hypothetical protein